MTQLGRIIGVSRALMQKYGTRNPFVIAEGEGITLVSCPDFQKLKGMYKVILDRRFIFLNAHLSREEARQVLAHELGHDALHREMASGSVVQDYFILNMTQKPEYEANLFAAELLVSSDKLKRLMAEGKDRAEAARLFRVPPEYIDLKLRVLSEDEKNTLC